jgi:hypothetical protein
MSIITVGIDLAKNICSSSFERGWSGESFPPTANKGLRPIFNFLEG